LRAYLNAQRKYATRDRDGDNVLQYAQKLGSTPGKHDGLYWPADAAKGEEASLSGPLVAEASPYLKGHAASDPYRGYYFRVLTQSGQERARRRLQLYHQRPHDRRFAMVAYPARWGESGVMTFIREQQRQGLPEGSGQRLHGARREDHDLRSGPRLEGSSP
jgi:hypothetical protein